MIGSTGLGSQAGSIVTSIGANTAAASGGNPIILAVAGLEVLAGTLISVLHIGEGCGPTCIQATKVVEDVEPVMLQNLEAYENGQIDQATAISNYNRLWDVVRQGCSVIPGAAGQNCINDRTEGACHYKQDAQPKYPGQPDIGQCWNWANGYGAPLNYPSKVPMKGTNDLATMMDISGLDPLWIGVGLIIAGLVVSK